MEPRPQKPFSYSEQLVNINGLRDSEAKMSILDPAAVLALAALITALSALIWSVRRKP